MCPEGAAEHLDRVRLEEADERLLFWRARASRGPERLHLVVLLRVRPGVERGRALAEELLVVSTAKGVIVATQAEPSVGPRAASCRLPGRPVATGRGRRHT